MVMQFPLCGTIIGHAISTLANAGCQYLPYYGDCDTRARTRAARVPSASLSTFPCVFPVALSNPGLLSWILLELGMTFPPHLQACNY